MLRWITVAWMALLPAAAAAQVLRPPVPSELPNPQPLQPTWEGMLFAQLEAGDRRLLPRLDRLPDGRLRVQYIRRAGEPELSLRQLQELMRHPPSWEQEKQAIRALLNRLRDLGVRLELAEPRKPTAAGEWEPRQAVVRIRPDVPLRGSQEFARVLNHEAIHVAQSCKAGGLRRHPLPLGIRRALSDSDRRLLSQPIYTSQPEAIRRLEYEAFGLQRDLTAGLMLLARHCPPAGRLGG